LLPGRNPPDADAEAPPPVLARDAPVDSLRFVEPREADAFPDPESDAARPAGLDEALVGSSSSSSLSLSLSPSSPPTSSALPSSPPEYARAAEATAPPAFARFLDGFATRVAVAEP